MIKDPGEQLHLFRTVPVIRTAVKDQNLFPFTIGEQRKNGHNFHGQAQHELTPVMPGVAQQVVGRILAKPQHLIFGNAPEEVLPIKGQLENRAEHFQRRGPSQFANTGVIEQLAELEVTEKRINGTLQTNCLLLLLQFLYILHQSFLLVFIMFLPNTIYQGAKDFSAKKLIISVC